jgi:hypothetical protein
MRVRSTVASFPAKAILVPQSNTAEPARFRASSVQAGSRTRNLTHAGPVLAFFLLVAATALAVYKPFGTTPYGARTLGRQGASFSSREPLGTSWTSASLYLVAAAALVGILLLLLHHLSGTPFHH